MKLTCPTCAHEFAIHVDSAEAECPNRLCHAPYRFRIFNNEDSATAFFKSVIGWRAKYLVSVGSRDEWAVAFFDSPIRPFRVPPISFLVGEEILRAIQAGSADNLGGPITLMEVVSSGEEAALRRVEPLEHAGVGERPAHMRRFIEFCARLRLACIGNQSGDQMCADFDVKVATEYLNCPPYHPRWHHCWCHLVDYIVPVIVHGELLGIIFSGQKRLSSREADETMEGKIHRAAEQLGLPGPVMVDMARQAPAVTEQEIGQDLVKLQQAARRLEIAAETKYASERQIREGYFLEEVESLLSSAALKSFGDDVALSRTIETVTRRIAEFLECFKSVALLIENRHEAHQYSTLCSFGCFDNGFSGSIEDESFEESTSERCDTLLVTQASHPLLYQTFSQRAVPFEMSFGYIVRITLRGARRMLLLLAADNHDCRYRAAPGFCHHRSRLGESFINRLRVALRNGIDVLLAVEERDSFLTRTAHSLSLPMQSIIADSESLIDELAPGSEVHRLAMHNYYEVQGLSLLVQNILHGLLDDSLERKYEFEQKSILLPLKEACVMFAGEAADKECDIRPMVVLNGDEHAVEPEELANEDKLYFRAVQLPLSKNMAVPGGPHVLPPDLKVILRTASGERTVRLENLVQECAKTCHASRNPEQVSVVASCAERVCTISAHKIAAKFLPPMEMVPAELSLAFKNLLHNAVKYSYRSVRHGKKRYVEIRLSKVEDRYYDVTISNYGIGIQPDEIAKGLIWKAGYRGKLSHDRNRTGSGLGLAHAKLAVEGIHGGRLDVHSMQQIGGAFVTNFTARIPVRQADRLAKKGGYYEWYRPL